MGEDPTAASEVAVEDATRRVVRVSRAQVIAAKGAIKAARKLGHEPDPALVRIANARPANDQKQRAPA